MKRKEVVQMIVDRIAELVQLINNEPSSYQATILNELLKTNEKILRAISYRG